VTNVRLRLSEEHTRGKLSSYLQEKASASGGGKSRRDTVVSMANGIRRAAVPPSAADYGRNHWSLNLGYFFERPLNELARSRPSEVMSRHSMSA
jgi:hypothetical protein